MSVLDGSDTGIVNRSKRTYVAVATATTQFYSYSVALNTTTYVNTGTLTGSAATVVAGTLLRENGKKLFPEANPGVTKYLVGVYLTESPFTSGFIDPNSKLFAIYNTDKPDYVPRGINPNGNTEVDQGAPVYTLGTVTAGTGIVTTSGQIRSATPVVLTAVTVSTGSATINREIDPSLGQLFTLTVTVTGGTNALTFSSVATPAAGSIVYLVIQTSASHTTAMAASEGTNLQMGSFAVGTVASKYFGITFVSDGTTLVQVGSSTTPVVL